MDLGRFDTLAQSVAAAGSRRNLLGLLAMLPAGGSIVALLHLDEVDAKDRRRRRKQRHKRRKSPDNHQHDRPRKTCQAASAAQTCAGKCGSITNNCHKPVDCGSCACDPACDVCFTCQDGPNTPGSCVVDPAQQGEACGAPGQRCQPDGSCGCDSVSCATGCCDGATCHIGDDLACGIAGGGCLPCTAPDTCGGGNTAGVCGCTPDCSGKACGASDGCGGSCQTGMCDACQTCSGGQCVVDASQDRTCCAGADGEQWCQAGACVPIPADARATLEECTGRCDCVPYDDNGCFGGLAAYQEICGATRLCPLCEQCDELVSECAGASGGVGPAGTSYYCVFGDVAGSCNAGLCPDPENQVCLGNIQCNPICGVAAP